MDIRNVYAIDGDINEEGIYIKDTNVNTYIAECRIANNEGYSYFAFKKKYRNSNLKEDMHVVRIVDLLTLISNANTHKFSQEELKYEISQEELQKLKEQILLILENGQGFNSQLQRYMAYFTKMQELKSKQNK